MDYAIELSIELVISQVDFHDYNFCNLQTNKYIHNTIYFCNNLLGIKYIQISL